MKNYNTKIICDFIGINFHESGTVSSYPSDFNLKMGLDTIEDIFFDKDWNMLMYSWSVLRKKIEYEDLMTRQFPFYGHSYSRMCEYVLTVNIEHACLCLLEGIKNYKEIKR